MLINEIPRAKVHEIPTEECSINNAMRKENRIVKRR